MKILPDEIPSSYVALDPRLDPVTEIGAVCTDKSDLKTHVGKNVLVTFKDNTHKVGLLNDWAYDYSLTDYTFRVGNSETFNRGSVAHFREV